MNPTANKFCSSCGRDLAKDAKFCDTCGIPLNPGNMKQEDWRGVLASAFTVVYGGVLATTAFATGNLDALVTIASILSPMEALVLGFYFGGKTSEFSPEELKAITQWSFRKNE